MFCKLKGIRSRKQKGMSLTELMIAGSIMSIVGGGIVKVFSSSTSSLRSLRFADLVVQKKEEISSLAKRRSQIVQSIRSAGLGRCLDADSVTCASGQSFGLALARTLPSGRQVRITGTSASPLRLNSWLNACSTGSPATACPISISSQVAFMCASPATNCDVPKSIQISWTAQLGSSTPIVSELLLAGTEVEAPVVSCPLVTATTGIGSQQSVIEKFVNGVPYCNTPVQPQQGDIGPQGDPGATGVAAMPFG
jgi:Tfp pilus assembly protein PilW